MEKQKKRTYTTIITTIHLNLDYKVIVDKYPQKVLRFALISILNCLTNFFAFHNETKTASF